MQPHCAFFLKLMFQELKTHNADKYAFPDANHVICLGTSCGMTSAASLVCFGSPVSALGGVLAIRKSGCLIRPVEHFLPITCLPLLHLFLLELGVFQHNHCTRHICTETSVNLSSYLANAKSLKAVMTEVAIVFSSLLWSISNWNVYVFLKQEAAAILVLVRLHISAVQSIWRILGRPAFIP